MWNQAFVAWSFDGIWDMGFRVLFLTCGPCTQMETICYVHELGLGLYDCAFSVCGSENLEFGPSVLGFLGLDLHMIQC